MGNRKRMKDRYRRFSFISDIEGMKNAIGEMKGKFFPKQPMLNQEALPADTDKTPDEEWFIKTIGEIFSQAIVREIVTDLMGQGILSIAPDVTPMFNKQRYPKVGWASPWSHRHIAYAAGLGTFGMQDFLITEKGCAHRLSSFVVNLKLEPNRQRPEDIHAYCLHYQGKKCLKCAARCPVDAITAEHAHNKETCYQKVADSLKFCIKNYHIFIYGCGLCATSVPCESGIPKPLRGKNGGKY